MNIINGTYHTDSDYEKFKDLYLHDLDSNMLTIYEKVGVSRSKGLLWSKRVREENGLMRKGMYKKIVSVNEKTEPSIHKKRVVKNYYKTPTGYIIQKYLDGKLRNFGVYKTEEEAQERVKRLRELNWSVIRD